MADREPLRRLEINGEATFVAINREKHRAITTFEWRPLARVVAAGRFHLDDVRAHVSQILRAQRTRQYLGEIEYTNPRERVERC